MAERMIGSLIYGQHQTPRTRSFRQRFLLPLIVAAAFLVIGALVYHFYNYREERLVRTFVAEVFSGNYDAAYARWDLTDGNYSMQDFMSDWGPEGYHTKGSTGGEVIDSNRRGHSVIVYVQTDPARKPVALLVGKETQKLSFSPDNKY